MSSIWGGKDRHVGIGPVSDARTFHGPTGSWFFKEKEGTKRILDDRTRLGIGASRIPTDLVRSRMLSGNASTDWGGVRRARNVATGGRR